MASIPQINQWFQQKEWTVFPFQQNCWEAIAEGKSGLLNAPTGSGKTFAIWLGLLARRNEQKKGLKILWITPLRALSKDIASAMQDASNALETGWRVGLRTGDTDTKTRDALRRNPPDALVTTPESLHLMLASKNYPDYFKHLDAIVVDEWHELIGSKRGVQIELALSRLKSIQPNLLIWGISATIGNLDEAMQVLLGKNHTGEMVRASNNRFPEIKTVFPDELEKLPWAGHLGIHLLPKVIPILQENQSTLLFTNTRSQAEIWYQELLNTDPSLAGQMAMHHGSISQELRTWVENALHDGLLRVVVCTSSLDLGVDFRPVDNIIQVGSPKGVARFIQRAGRSGHRPGAISKIWFVPTHSLELIEIAAIREAVATNTVEARIPIMLSMDVLVQYLITLAVSDGFVPDELYRELIQSYAYQNLSEDAFQWAIQFITSGGEALSAYPDFAKTVFEDGKLKVKDKRTAMRHRLHMGTIVSDPVLTVKYLGGGRLGTIEEWFIAKLKPGDIFWFGGKVLELIQVRDMVVSVKRSNKKQGQVPQWMGGRMPLSSQLSELIRLELDKVKHNHDELYDETRFMLPLFELQQARSTLPDTGQFLIEVMQSRDGHHVFFYPFEGRLVHEGLASLFSYRISKLTPITCSFAMNDYGFELLSDQEIPIREALEEDLFTMNGLHEDILESINSSELARRRFRDISGIAGLVFQGYPGKLAGTKHLQTSSRLLFDVFQQYDPSNELLAQAYREVFTDQLEEERLRMALERINTQEIILNYPTQYTPFSFPILVDRLRGKMSTETIEDRVKKMLAKSIR
jgi:ATP-dependent helicase Lhr and Lhr-like helicase